MALRQQGSQEHRKVAKNTVTVILCTLCVGVFIWLFDGVAGLAYSTLLSAFGG